jgi:hypothetical protein
MYACAPEKPTADYTAFREVHRLRPSIQRIDVVELLGDLLVLTNRGQPAVVLRNDRSHSTPVTEYDESRSGH